MSVCIHYHAEAYSTKGERLMGRNAAGESFLKGFFLHSKQADSIWVHNEDQEEIKNFTKPSVLKSFRSAIDDRNKDKETLFLLVLCQVLFLYLSAYNLIYLIQRIGRIMQKIAYLMTLLFLLTFNFEEIFTHPLHDYFKKQSVTRR